MHPKRSVGVPLQRGGGWWLHWHLSRYGPTPLLQETRENHEMKILQTNLDRTPPPHSALQPIRRAQPSQRIFASLRDSTTQFETSRFCAEDDPCEQRTAARGRDREICSRGRSRDVLRRVVLWETGPGCSSKCSWRVLWSLAGAVRVGVSPQSAFPTASALESTSQPRALP